MGVGLTRALEELRRELGEAQDAGRNQQLRFTVKEAQVEFLIELREEGGADGKLSFGVLSAGAAAKSGTTQAHRLTLMLDVSDAATGGSRVDVGRDTGGRAWDE